MSNLASQFRGALATLPQSSFPQRVDVADGARTLVCELASLDTLACSVNVLTLATDALAAATTEQLKKISQKLSARLTYLLEPISPIEVDPLQCVVQMRSNPPQQGESQASYYELLVRRGGEISLRRYQKDKGQPRAVVPAVLTREVLCRLAGDFEAVV